MHILVGFRGPGTNPIMEGAAVTCGKSLDAFELTFHCILYIVRSYLSSPHIPLDLPGAQIFIHNLVSLAQQERGQKLELHPFQTCQPHPMLCTLKLFSSPPLLP